MKSATLSQGTTSTDGGNSQTYKVVMLGDKSVGKTCIVKRYTEKSFDEDVEATIGSSFSSCVVKIRPDNVLEEVKVRL
eukprot:CAMPEP_0116875372 /NCGR_PEP_ID=MMETSP0463-20121206/7306_1 /TAXON_ID=181622 /ORGANISM="Strombidinopsis sp, Strain SopsisLIS2011" /LENGTH=77 /DNA_ID=CAMNT_0004520895 /DNA_START=127 /DNA_END=360 /DNA_ORIENTATION=-